MKGSKKILCVIGAVLIVFGCIGAIITKGGVALETKSKAVKLNVFIEQANVEVVQSIAEEGIKAEYDELFYDVKIESNKENETVNVKSKKGDNKALPVKLYIPNQKWDEINLVVKDGSVECDSVFERANIICNVDSSNVDLKLPSGFKGSFKGNAKGSNFNFISSDKYKDCDVKITNLGGVIEVPKYFSKHKNVYTYSQGNKSIDIELVVEDYGMTEFE